jgi:formate hydrogenlyase subunit 3/multisubunit Na+/H+ antiporter MnhD subunit
MIENTNVVMLPVIILLPMAAGILGYLVRRLRTELDFLGFFLTLYFSIRIFMNSRTQIMSFSFGHFADFSLRFYLDGFTGLIILFNSIITFLVWFYALRALSKTPKENLYYLFLGLTLGAANGVLLSGNLFLLAVLLILILFAQYGFFRITKNDQYQPAPRSMAVIGSADLLMILGLVILLLKSGGRWSIPFETPLALSGFWTILSFLLIVFGIIGKMGAVPFHSWVPEAAAGVPASTMAYLPAALSRLLGVYLLFRFTYYIFDLPSSLPLRLVLMAIGSLTVIGGVLAEVRQKETMRLIAYNGVCQTGYVIVGMGTGLTIGMTGAIFHALNNVVGLSALFLAVGSVEYRARTTDLDSLGGLAKKMPLTAFSFIIAGLAVSGIPPLNGFFSKWMLYQGVLGLSSETVIWPIFLIALMFGSVLTLISYFKLIHTIFLGERPRELDKVHETRFEMATPTLILALTCLVFGIFAYQVPLGKLINTSLPFKPGASGYWSPVLATILILIALLIGLILYALGSAFRSRSTAIFTGGEKAGEEPARFSGTSFYSDLHRFHVLEWIGRSIEDGIFDIYYYLKKLTGAGRKTDA